MELQESRIVFDPDGHTYTAPDGRHLQGITGMLSRQLFPGKYDGVDEHTLRMAAERGSEIHSLCEMADEGFMSDEPEVQDYVSLKVRHGLMFERSEYLVSDNETFASCIDKVYREDGESFTLADIKTTYTLDTEYVRWQLSVYAYLFEMQNPGAKAVRLLAVWLRPGKSRIEEVGRIPDDTVRELLQCEAEGRQFSNPYAPASCDMPEKYRQMEAEIRETVIQARQWEARMKELKDGIQKEMVKAGVYSWDGGGIAFTRRKESIREGFDRKRFAEEHPDLYREYMKEVQVAGSLTIELK